MRRYLAIWSRAAAALALTVPLLAGCAGRGAPKILPAEQLNASVEETILDQDRRAEMLALSEEYVAFLDQLVGQLEEGRESLDRLVADYSSDREQFDTFFDHYATRRREISEQVIEIHLAMKELATDEEWKSLQKATQRVTSTMLGTGLASVSGEE